MQKGNTIRMHQGYGITQIPHDKILRFVVDTDYISVDPAFVSDYVGIIISQALFEPLLTLDIEGNIVPGAAESYVTNTEKNRYIFCLRKNLRWSDGSSLTAYDFEYAFKRLVKPQDHSLVSSLTYPILNAFEINTSEIEDIDELGVHALNERVLEINLEFPCVQFPEILTCINLAPVPQAIVKQHRLNWCTPEVIISNGAFALKKYERNEYISLKTNPYHYNNDYNKTIQGITFIILNDFKKQLDLYRNNHVHLTCNTMFNFKDINFFKGFKDFNIKNLAILSVLILNFEDPFFRELDVRKALFLSIDKEEIEEKFFQGIEANNSFIPKGIKHFEYKQSPQVFYDRYTSQFLFQRIQQTLKVKKKQISIIFADYYPNQQILEIVSQMWKETLGIDTFLKKVPFADLEKYREMRNFDVIFSLMSPYYNDPLSFFQSFIVPEAFEENMLSYYVETCYRASAEDDIVKRKIIYNELNEILFRCLPVIPLFNHKSIYLQKEFIESFSILSSGDFIFRSIDIDDSIRREV